MKRLFALFTVSVFALTSLVGCGSSSAPSADSTTEKLSVVTTIFPQYDFVREIAGDNVDVTMLLKPGAESHSYEPTPQDIIAIQNCDLFIYTGGHNDTWVADLLASFGADAPKAIQLIDLVDTVTEETVEGMEHSHGEGEVCDHDHDHTDECYDDHGDLICNEDHVHDENCDHDHDDHDHDHDHDEEHVHDEHCDHDHEHDEDCYDDHGDLVCDEDHDHDHVHDENCDHDHDDHEHSDECYDDHGDLVCDHDHDDHVHDENCDHDHGEVDEHVWTSVRNAATIVEALSAILSNMDADNATTYASNSQAYIAQLNDLDAQFTEVVANGTGNTILLADRFPFRYFVDDYGLEYYAAFTGCSTQTDPSAATVVFLIDKTNELGLPVVLTMELSNGKVAETICESTGATHLTLYSCHNVTADQMSAGVSYLDMMTENVDTLRQALN